MIDIISESIAVPGHELSTFLLAYAYIALPFFIIKDIPLGGRYSESFISTWKWMLLITWVGSFFGGTYKSAMITFTVGNIWGFIGELIGMAIAIWLLPLILTYIVTFTYNILKPVMKKIHDISNKE